MEPYRSINNKSNIMNLWQKLILKQGGLNVSGSVEYACINRTKASIGMNYIILRWNSFDDASMHLFSLIKPSIWLFETGIYNTKYCSC